MSGRRLRRRFTSGLMTGVVVTLAGLAVLPLLLIFGYLVAKGATSINLDFFLKTPVPAGQSGGGVAHAIVGSAIVVGLASLIGVPIGIGAGVFLAEYGAGRLGWLVRFVADVMNGTPSIIIGIFAWAFMVKPLGFFSALAGAVALAVILVPLIARTTEEMIKLVPHSLREAALALGAPKWKVILSVVLPTARAGVITASVLALARSAGETAPLLLTALGNDFFSTDLLRPIGALPLQIYRYAISPYDDWHTKAWGTSLVLVFVIGLVGVLLRYVARPRVR